MPTYWTHDDDERLRRLIRTGTPWKHIRRITGRTFRAARMRLFRLNETCDAIRHAPNGCRSMHETAQLLNISDHTLIRWVRLEYLQATRPAKRSGVRYITDDALRQFLRNPAYWMLWSPTVITDDDWRHYAETERRLADGRWLTPGELAHALGRQITTIHEHLQKNHIPGVVKRSRYYYIWSRALDGWPPLQGRRL